MYSDDDGDGPSGPGPHEGKPRSVSESSSTSKGNCKYSGTSEAKRGQESSSKAPKERPKSLHEDKSGSAQHERSISPTEQPSVSTPSSSELSNRKTTSVIEPKKQLENKTQQPSDKGKPQVAMGLGKNLQDDPVKDKDVSKRIASQPDRNLVNSKPNQRYKK